MVTKIGFILCVLDISLVMCKLGYKDKNFEYGPPINSIVSFFISCGFSTIRVNIANSTNNEALDIANDILSEKNFVKILMNASNSLNINRERKRLPMILILESLSELKSIEYLIAYDNPKYYLVILTKSIFANFNEVLHIFRNYSMFDVIFLVRKKQEFLLFTFFPFNNGKCGNELTLQLINTYNGKWMNKEFYPKKIRNLNKCEITIGVNPSIPFTMIEIDKSTNEKIYDGIEVEMIRILGKTMNF